MKTADVIVGRSVRLNREAGFVAGRVGTVTSLPSPRTRAFNVRLDDGSIVRVAPFMVEPHEEKQA